MCGTDKSIRYCKNCNRPYQNGEKFCSICGASLICEAQTTKDILNDQGIRLQQGEEGAFEQIYQMTQGWVRGVVCQKLMGADVEDCMQEIYVKLYEKIEKFDPSKGMFRPWFNVLVKNVTIDFYRKKEGKQGKDTSMYVGDDEEIMDFVSEDLTIDPEASMDQKESRRLVAEVLEKIPKEQRVCIMMYFLNGMKQKEIAQKLGVPEGTVKTRIMHGKAAVKEGILDLEKKHGTKLYGMSPIVFFFWLLHAQDSTAVWNGVKVQVSGLQMVAHETIKNGTASNASAASKHIAKKAMAAGAKETVKTAVRKGIAVKMIAGIAAVTVLGDAAITYHQYQMKQDLQSETEEVKQETTPDIQTIADYLSANGQEYVGRDSVKSSYTLVGTDNYELEPIENYKDGYWTVKSADYGGGISFETVYLYRGRD